MEEKQVLDMRYKTSSFNLLNTFDEIEKGNTGQEDTTSAINLSQKHQLTHAKSPATKQELQRNTRSARNERNFIQENKQLPRRNNSAPESGRSKEHINDFSDTRLDHEDSQIVGTRRSTPSNEENQKISFTSQFESEFFAESNNIPPRKRTAKSLASVQPTPPYRSPQPKSRLKEFRKQHMVSGSRKNPGLPPIPPRRMKKYDTDVNKEVSSIIVNEIVMEKQDIDGSVIVDDVSCNSISSDTIPSSSVFGEPCLDQGVKRVEQTNEVTLDDELYLFDQDPKTNDPVMEKMVDSINDVKNDFENMISIAVETEHKHLISTGTQTGYIDKTTTDKQVDTSFDEVPETKYGNQENVTLKVPKIDISPDVSVCYDKVLSRSEHQTDINGLELPINHRTNKLFIYDQTMSPKKLNDLPPFSPNENHVNQFLLSNSSNIDITQTAKQTLNNLNTKSLRYVEPTIAINELVHTLNASKTEIRQNMNSYLQVHGIAKNESELLRQEETEFYHDTNGNSMSSTDGNSGSVTDQSSGNYSIKDSHLHMNIGRRDSATIDGASTPGVNINSIKTKSNKVKPVFKENGYTMDYDDIGGNITFSDRKCVRRRFWSLIFVATAIAVIVLTIVIYLAVRDNFGSTSKILIGNRSQLLNSASSLVSHTIFCTPTTSLSATDIATKINRSPSIYFSRIRLKSSSDTTSDTTHILPTRFSSYYTLQTSVIINDFCGVFAEQNLKSMTTDIGLPQWRCQNNSCVLHCRQPGFKTYKPYAFCDNVTGQYDHSWTNCLLVNPCTNNPCSLPNSVCVNVVPGQYRCKCEHGYAGNGSICGVDSDLDNAPDRNLSCVEETCKKDNCLKLPNPDQSDIDGDDIGDMCDEDRDGDALPNYIDNCPDIKSSMNEDKDGDGIGDTCDNCVDVKNADQIDSDFDGIGNSCDNDADNDGIENVTDNCWINYNPDQIDTDGDGYGDACDNCIHVSNNDQLDVNMNLVGDACEGYDEDDDSIYDSQDNCKAIPNAHQVDTDSDGIGDSCDDNIDGDDHLNLDDNCPYVKNNDQLDTNGNGVGDICEGDTDGDGWLDYMDDFPTDRNASGTTFKNSFNVNVGKNKSNELYNEWSVINETNILKNNGSDPSMLLTKNSYSDLRYTGLLYVKDSNTSNERDGFVGLVFSYQSNRNFYLLSWKRKTSVFIDTDEIKTAHGGISLKKIHSSNADVGGLKDAICRTRSSLDQSQTLWFDKTYVWEYETLYQWEIQHYPTSGLIKINIYRVNSSAPLLSSGELYDTDYAGGRVGVYTFLQNNVLFANIRAVSLKDENYAVRLDGQSDGSEMHFGTLNDFISTNDSFALTFKVKVDGVANLNCNMKEITFGTPDYPSFLPFHQMTDDEGDWVLTNETDAITGPTTEAKGLGGNFAYVNASAGKLGDRHVLLSDWFYLYNCLKTKLYISFYNYAPVGKLVGSLQIEIRTPSSGWRLLWVEHKNEGKYWRPRKIKLQEYDNKAVQLRITASQSFYDNSIIAIDDISFGVRCEEASLCGNNKYYIVGSNTEKGLELALSGDTMAVKINENQYTVGLTQSFPFGQFVTVTFGCDPMKRKAVLVIDGDEHAFNFTMLPDYSSRIYVGETASKLKTMIVVDEVQIWNNVSTMLKYKHKKVDEATPSLAGLFRMNKGHGNIIKNEVFGKPNGVGRNLRWMTLPV